MGVDYFPCDGCNKIVRDCDCFYSCICGKYFCEECLSELSDIFEVDDNQFISCWFCTEKKDLRRVTDEEFIEWLINISGKTKNNYLDYLVKEGQLF